MSLFTDASMVLVPSAIKNQKIYSVKPTDGSGDLTFSRASNATRVNSSGLVEKVRTNEALYSEDFTNAYWLKTNVTITGNSVANPLDGLVTADTFTPTNTSATNRIRSASISLASAGFSIYVKSNGYSKVGIREDITTGNWASYDLATGTVLDSSGVISPTITALANGWYRISLGVTATPVGMGVWVLDPTYTSGSFSTSNWTADGTSGIYVFGAQIEAGDIATDYIATTSSAVSVGPVSGLPRLDYSGGASCPSLLLEPQRTNLVTYSEQFDNAAYTRNGYAVTANSAISPDGYQNADLMYQTVSGDKDFYTTFPVTTGTFSIYAKAAGKNWFYITDSVGANPAYYNISNGTLGTVAGGSTATITSVGNGWYRLTYYRNQAGGYTFFKAVDTDNSQSSTASGTDGALIWGAQYEAGAYPTSYIPTLSTSVTRVADAASKTGISSLIGQTAGTFFAEYTADSFASGARIVTLSDGTLNTRITLFCDSNEKIHIYAATLAGGQQIDQATTIDFTGNHKVAFAYANNDLAVYVDGTQAITSSGFSVPACSNMYLGSVNIAGIPLSGGIKQSLLFTSRLTNADLATLTA